MRPDTSDSGSGPPHPRGQAPDTHCSHSGCPSSLAGTRRRTVGRRRLGGRPPRAPGIRHHCGRGLGSRDLGRRRQVRWAGEGKRGGRVETETDRPQPLDLARRDPLPKLRPLPASLSQAFPPSPPCLVGPGPAWRQRGFVCGGSAQIKEAPSFASVWGRGGSRETLADREQVRGTLPTSTRTSSPQQPGLHLGARGGGGRRREAGAAQRRYLSQSRCKWAP